MNVMTKQQAPWQGFYNENPDIKLNKTTLEVKALIKINWIYARVVYCQFLAKRNSAMFTILVSLMNLQV